MPGIQKQQAKRPTRTPDEWGMLKPAQLETAVLMELNIDRIKTDSDGNRWLWRMAPKRVFIPRDEVEAAKVRGYVVVPAEDVMHWSKYRPTDAEREPLAIELLDDWSAAMPAARVAKVAETPKPSIPGAPRAG